jgi:hypothetical protein
MKALELYEGVFDTARKEYQGTDLESMVSDIVEYADGVFCMTLSDSNAAILAECAIDYEEKTWGDNGNGEYENNYFVCVTEKLRHIEF